MERFLMLEVHNRNPEFLRNQKRHFGVQSFDMEGATAKILHEA
jgi:hypothetical protein